MEETSGNETVTMKGQKGRLCCLCRGDHFHRIYTHVTGLPLVRCAHCGLIFFLFSEDNQIQTLDYWSTGGSQYNLEVYSDPAVIREAKRMYNGYLDQLEAEIGVGKLIDYGCGIGTFIECAQARGWEAYGLDVSEAAVGYARARGLPVWTLDEWRAMKLKVEKVKVDAVTMWDVIEHVDDPPKTLRFVSSLLRNKGILLIETPSADYLFKRLSLQLAKLSRSRVDSARFFFYPNHHFYFTRKTLEQLLKNCGFRTMWAQKTVTSKAKLTHKLRKVHRAGSFIRILAQLALQATRLLGGNKILICARKEPKN